jgi:hypothetical protein
MPNRYKKMSSRQRAQSKNHNPIIAKESEVV